MITTIILTCSGPSVLARDLFDDVSETDWAAPYIYNLAERNIVGGHGDGTFKPLNNVLRCEYAKMLVNIANVEIVSSTVSPYVDVFAWDWYFPYVNSSPFITGYMNDGALYFAPNEPATREDVTVAMVKVLGIDVANLADSEAYLASKFSDWESISSYNRAYVAAAVKKGVITGDESGTFRADDPIIRAEVVAVLYRAFPDEKNVMANPVP